MARPTRLVFPGHPHHLLQRGNNRQPIFLDDLDRQHYREWLRQAATEQRVDVHAYVLMDNHVHLLVTPHTAEGLSKLMQAVGRRYVAWFNLRHQRTGTLWEGRYKASVIQATDHLLACQRYIELNPFRAGLVPSLLDSPWSSLNHHLGARREPLITDHPCYWSLGNTPFEREAAYRRWLEEGVPPRQALEITQALGQMGVLGDATFRAHLGDMVHRDLSPRPRGRPKKGMAPDGASI
jgi:putative transposase